MSWYRTGTVSVTNGSAVVTGTGTAFVANVQAGHAINLPDGKVYEVAAINSDTQITLGSNYLGSTATGQGYSVQPNQGFAQQAATMLASFIAQYGAFLLTALSGRFGDGSNAAPGISFVGDQDTGFDRPSSNTIAVVTGGTPVARFDTHTTTWTDPATGISFDIIGRTDNTATIRLFSGDASTITGSLTYTTTGLYLQAPLGDLLLSANGSAAVYLANSNGRLVRMTNTALEPLANGTLSLANASARFANLYLVSSPNVSSDERLKQWRGALTADELAAAKDISSEIGIYQMLAAIEEKGAAAARLHTGVKAQRIIAILTAHGLTWSRYGFIGHDTWSARAAIPAVAEQLEVRNGEGEIVIPYRSAEPGCPAIAAGDSYNVRYDELAMFLAAAQEQRLLAIEARLAA